MLDVQKYRHRVDYRDDRLYEEDVFDSNPGASGELQHQMKKSLLEALTVIWRGKWAALGVFMIVAPLVFAVSMMKRPVYSAYSLLLVDTGKNTDGAMNYGVVSGGVDPRGQLLILQESQFVAERTAERLIERRLLPGTNALLPLLSRDRRPLYRRLTDPGHHTNPPTAFNADEIAAILQKEHLRVTAEGHYSTGALRITATSLHPDEATLIAATYAEEYVKLSQETSRQRITASRAFLERQIARHRAELQTIEVQISEMMRREDMSPSEAGTQHIVAQIVRLESALDDARLDLTVEEASVRALEEELEQLRPLLTQQSTTPVAEEIEKTRAQLARLEKIVEPVYLHSPRLQSTPPQNEELADLQRRINELQERVRGLSAAYADEVISGAGLPTRGESVLQAAQLKRQIVSERILLDAVKARVQGLEQRLVENKRILQSMPEQAARLAQLQRTQESTELLYASLLGKLQEVRLAEESEVGFARIIRPATLAALRGPSRQRTLLLASVMGLMFAVLGAIARHWLDTRVYTPDDLDRRGMHMIGTVPDLKELMQNGFARAQVNVVDGKPTTFVGQPRDQLSLACEAYRYLQIALQFRFPHNMARTVLVTSPEAAVGKSTTALNLALSAAASGRRTLIVDADLRKPDLHHYIGQHSQSDLLEMLDTGAVDLDRLATGIGNLFVVTVSEPVANTAEVFGSDRLVELIDTFRKRFDLVIFDSPPALAVTDALILGALCEATIVVASAGSTDGDVLAHTVGELGGVGATVAGVVLNRFQPSGVYKHTYGYRYGTHSQEASKSAQG